MGTARWALLFFDLQLQVKKTGNVFHPYPDERYPRFSKHPLLHFAFQSSPTLTGGRYCPPYRGNSFGRLRLAFREPTTKRLSRAVPLLAPLSLIE